MKRLLGVVVLAFVMWTVGVRGAANGAPLAMTEGRQSTSGGKMELGNFSISLAVKDLKKSQEFYEKLGFQRIDGSKPGQQMPEGKDWAILQNGKAIIGLFRGMFDQNVITFNPLDIRAVAAEFKRNGIELSLQNMYGPLTDTSPAFATLTDPDGNHLLFDQHLPTK